MNRQIIVNKLLKEGFSQKTLMNFSDKELKSLSSRILGESEVMIPKSDPMLKQKVAAAQKEKKTIETYESKDLKGGQKKLDKNHNGKLDSQDFKILRGKKSEVKERYITHSIDERMMGPMSVAYEIFEKVDEPFEIKDLESLVNEYISYSEISPNVAKRFMEDESWWDEVGYNVKELIKKFGGKEGDKPFDTHESKDLKGGQKKLDKNNNGKLDSQDFKMLRSNKSEVKEEKPSAGLSKEKKSEVVKKAKKGGDIGKKGKGFKEIEKSAKKGGAKDPKAVAAAAMWKNIKREQVEVSEWVEKLAEQKYHSFTSKKEIMEMIGNKMGEVEVGPKVTKGHNGIPEFMTSKSLLGLKNSDVKTAPAPVKTPTPVKDPSTKPKDPFRPKPGKNPRPKASLSETDSDVKTAPAPVETPVKNPSTKPKDPFRPKPGKNPRPKARLSETEKNENPKK